MESQPYRLCESAGVYSVKSTILTSALPNLLVRLWRYLSRRRQRQFGLLMGLMLLSAFAEVVSMGAVLPFLGILTAPDLVFSHPIVSDVVLAWGITSADQLVLPLTVAFAAAALRASAIRILLLWASTRIACGSGADLGIDARPILPHRHLISIHVKGIHTNLMLRVSTSF